jgi:PKD repeat protein
MKRSVVFTLIFFFGVSLKVHGQRTCGTMEHELWLKQQYPQIQEEEDRANEMAILLAEKIKSKKHSFHPNGKVKQVITIPVVVHIVYRLPSENITNVQVQSQIQVLNEDFRKLNADTVNIPSWFKSLAADFEIEFCLAQIDPYGNPTTGITRTQTTVASFTSDDKVKSSATGGKDPWPTNQYLNIWVCNLSGGLLGYAQFPWDYSSSPNTDGVVINYRYFGRGGSAQAPFNKGRTATHEVGHWLGLYHTFRGGCAGTSPTTCNTGGDRVCDTPPTASSNYGCPGTQNTCTETPTNMYDMTNNFMDYVDDACMNMFTAGQKTRVYSMLNLHRSWVFNASGKCNLTPTAPTANFSATPLLACVNSMVQLKDQSSGGVTNWSWSISPNTYTFVNGTSASSQNPQVQFTAPGTYTVTLIVSNAQGSDTLTKTNYISIGNGFPLPFYEDFESGDFSTNGWTVENPDNSYTWEITAISGSSLNGSNAAYINFYDYAKNGEIDALISPPLDFSNLSHATLTFHHAYRMYSAPGTYPSDSLFISISTDCGQTYTTLLKLGESGTNYTLATMPYSSSSFTPSSASHWCHTSSYSQGCYSINLDPYVGSSGIRIKFEGYCNYENNLYIDNISITGTVTGIIEAQTPSIEFYPNPTSSILYVKIHKPASISVLSLTGKRLYHAFVESAQILQIPVEAFPQGFYLLSITTEEGTQTYKFVKH